MIIGKIEEVTTALALALTSVEEIEKELAAMDKAARCACRMTIAMVVAVEMSRSVSKEVGQHPRDVMEQIITNALANLPEKPPQELPTRKSRGRPGPSPWSL